MRILFSIILLIGYPLYAQTSDKRQNYLNPILPWKNVLMILFQD